MSLRTPARLSTALLGWASLACTSAPTRHGDAPPASGGISAGGAPNGGAGAALPVNGAGGDGGRAGVSGTSGAPTGGFHGGAAGGNATGGDAAGGAAVGGGSAAADASFGGVATGGMRGSPDAGDGGNDGGSCPDGFARGNASGTSRRIAAFTPSAEGVTVCPNGEVFVSADDGVLWRVPLDGSPTERWATVGDRQPAGIACDRQSRLFVAVYSVRSGGGSPAVMRVDRKDGDAITLPAPNDQTLFGLNGIVAIAGLGIYATDTIGGLILRLRETRPNVFETDTVATGVLFANGLAYQPSSRTLHAVSSLAMQVLTFDVATDGTLGNRKTVASRSMALFDGVAVDERGAVYAADYSGGSVLRLGDSTSVGKFTNPASLAFRGGTLLVTDYRLNQPTVEGSLYAVDLGVCGAS